MSSTNYPLGACEIVFDATDNGASNSVKLNQTLEDQDTVLVTSSEVYKVLVDQLAGALIAQHISGEEPVTVTCSEIMKESQLPDITAMWKKHETLDSVAYDPHSVGVMYGTLRVHPLANGADVTRDFIGPKVFCRPNIVANFKAQDKVRVDFVFEFAADSDETSPTYGKILTIGDYS